MFELLLIWLPLCFVVAWVASQKGLSGAGMFFLSFFLSPLVGFLVTIALPARHQAAGAAGTAKPTDLILCHSCNRPKRADAHTCPHCGNGPPPPIDPHAGQKKCPACAEWIQQEAIKCRYCGEQMAPATPGPLDTGAMGYCQGCGKMRHSSVPRCVYCRDAAPVTATPPAIAARPDAVRQNDWDRVDRIDREVDPSRRRDGA